MGEVGRGSAVVSRGRRPARTGIAAVTLATALALAVPAPGALAADAPPVPAEIGRAHV